MDTPTGLVWSWAALDLVFLPLLFIGGIGAVAGWDGAAWVLVGTVALVVGGHILVAAATYRRIMRRPWPHVEPLQDDPAWDD